jgi:hypothetical protein
MTIDINLTNSVQLVSDDADEFFASSITKNPNITWAKFILADDQPNANKHVINQDQFASVIFTGTHMPIKMALEDIAEDHKASLPIGTITNLKQEGNKILGLAALWLKERTHDVELLKEKFAAGQPLNLSWEMSAMANKREDGIEELSDIVLNAATLVTKPAYEGRTPILALASKDEKPDEAQLKEANVEELEQLKVTLAELQTKFDELQAAKTAQEEELTTLRAFKAGIEAEASKANRFAAIKAQFVEAGLEMGDEYFDEKKDTLLALDENSINFMVQELVGLQTRIQASASKSEDKTDPKKVAVPNIKSSDKKELTVKDLAQLMNEAKL